MRIQIFPPLAFLAVVGMLFMALRPGLERAQNWRAVLETVPDNGFSVVGDGLKGMVISEGGSIEIAGSAADPYAVLGSVGFVTNEDVNGVHYMVPPDVVRLMRGKNVDIEFDVRAASGEPSEEWMVRAAIVGSLDTGWTRLPAGADWTPAKIQVPVAPTERYLPLILMLWSDAKGDGGRLDLRRISILPTAEGDGGA